jgi:hypothetical protein
MSYCMSSSYAGSSDIELSTGSITAAEASCDSPSPSINRNEID